MEHRLRLGGVHATYSTGLVLQTSHQDDFFYPHYFHEHVWSLPAISPRPLPSIYSIVQTQKTLIRSTLVVGG